MQWLKVPVGPTMRGRTHSYFDVLHVLQESLAQSGTHPTEYLNQPHAVTRLATARQAG